MFFGAEKGHPQMSSPMEEGNGKWDFMGIIGTTNVYNQTVYLDQSS